MGKPCVSQTQGFCFQEPRYCITRGGPYKNTAYKTTPWARNIERTTVRDSFSLSAMSNEKKTSHASAATTPIMEIAVLTNHHSKEAEPCERLRIPHSVTLVAAELMENTVVRQTMAQTSEILRLRQVENPATIASASTAFAYAPRSPAPR